MQAEHLGQQLEEANAALAHDVSVDLRPYDAGLSFHRAWPRFVPLARSPCWVSRFCNGTGEACSLRTNVVSCNRTALVRILCGLRRSGHNAGAVPAEFEAPLSIWDKYKVRALGN